MKCPICTTTDLLMTQRLGIEIDYCPHCRGVWLDRELDNIIGLGRRASTLPAAARGAPVPILNEVDSGGSFLQI